MVNRQMSEEVENMLKAEIKCDIMNDDLISLTKTLQYTSIGIGVLSILLFVLL